MKIEPLADRIVVKPMDPKEKTQGGLIIPVKAQEKSQEAEVIEVGPGRWVDGKMIAPDVKVGDKILFGKYTGSEITLDDVQYLIIRECDILARLKSEEK